MDGGRFHCRRNIICVKVTLRVPYQPTWPQGSDGHLTVSVLWGDILINAHSTVREKVLERGCSFFFISGWYWKTNIGVVKCEFSHLFSLHCSNTKKFVSRI